MVLVVIQYDMFIYIHVCLYFLHECQVLLEQKTVIATNSDNISSYLCKSGDEIFCVECTPACLGDTYKQLIGLCSIYSYSSPVLLPHPPRARTHSPSLCPCYTTSVPTLYSTWSPLGDNPRPPPSWPSLSSYRTSTTLRVRSASCSQLFSTSWLT